MKSWREMGRRASDKYFANEELKVALRQLRTAIVTARVQIKSCRLEDCNRKELEEDTRSLLKLISLYVPEDG